MWRSIIRPEIHLIQLKNTPIFEQLQLEEALLRADGRNFCILNHGSPRAIVMGISGEADKLLDVDAVKREGIPVIKRFSGGGTVIVDENTLFVTFIMNKSALPIHPFPEPILRWSAELYEQAWQIPHFQLRENDYCIDEKKCGGNAQYIKKERWLHHTSFLWDYSEKNMGCLQLPTKRPKYRQDRPHHAFLTKLKNYAKSPETMLAEVRETLVKQLYISDFDLSGWQERPHRHSVHFVDV
ncbi:MAG: lipoate--protein ligase family protein [Chlamydiales bacterium]